MEKEWIETMEHLRGDLWAFLKEMHREIEMDGGISSHEQLCDMAAATDALKHLAAIDPRR